MAGCMDQEEAAPSDNLYVSDLPPDTTEESLRSMFGPGVSQCRVLPSKTPGQGACVALVRFSSVKEAILVRETLNGAIPPGQQRPVQIRFCGRPEQVGMGGSTNRSSPYGGGTTGQSWGCGGKGGKPSEGERPPNDNLYVTGLPPGIDNESVRQLFGQYGTVTQCKVLPAPNESMPRHALVRFTSAEEAASVKKSLTGYALEGVNEPLVIEFAIKKEQGQDSWPGQQTDYGCEKGEKGGDKGCKGPYGGKGCSKGGWGGGCCGGKGDWGGKGGCDSGKGGFKGTDLMAFGGMEQIMQGFLEAQCLPGHDLGNEDNALYISGLPKDCDDIHLYRLLAPFGAITPTGVKAMKYPDGACKGFGFVNFIDPADMQAAATMLHGTQLPDGSIMNVVPKKAGKVRRPGMPKGGCEGYEGFVDMA